MATNKKRVTAKGSVRYDVRWRLPNGEGRSKSFDRWEDADEFRKRVERDELAGLVTDHRAGTVLLEPYAERWLDNRIVAGRPLTPSTRQGYEALLRRNINPRFGTTPLRRITPENVRKWYAEVTADASADQAAKSYRLLRAILNTAVDDEAIARNPCRIRGGGTERADERPMIPTDMVLDLADVIGSRYRGIILLSGLAGLRTGEMLGLRRRDIDLLHGTVEVSSQAQEISRRGRIVLERTKSDAGRRKLHLPPVAVEVLREQLELFAEPGPDGFVFTGPNGTPLRRATLSAAWRAACRKVGAPEGLHIHDCRHHAATLLARMPGITLKELMARIGHSTPRAALIYQHATEERDRAQADYIASAVAAVERTPLAAVADLVCDERAMPVRATRRRRPKKTA